MLVYQCRQAVGLLTAAPNAVDPTDGPPVFAAPRPVLQQLAVPWEILDPREVRYVLARADDCQADLSLLRCRHRHLSNAPRLMERERFPGRTLVDDLLTFNRAYHHYPIVRQSASLIHGEAL
jgi:hypothetical protein